MAAGVYMLRFAFKSILSICIFLIACDNIPRDNLLDPKNPAGFRPQIVVLEAFLNTNEDIPEDYNSQMIIALNRLAAKYEDKINIIEYHRNVGTYPDSLHVIENENLYSKYINYFEPGSEGVPDLFINGTGARIQGAFEAVKTQVRIEQALEPYLIENCYFALEPIVTITPGRVGLATKIARLGTTSEKNILVKAVVMSFKDSPYHQRVVREIKKSNIIEQIYSGEVKEIAFTDFEFESSEQLSVIFQITSADELRIYQSKKVSIK
jgi:hypothetical protein